ncbi:AAA family ATPase [Flavobacterium oreochromis]|uniref:AAA family ATPase n=1 Tax=Flavobacterium oreochromis TaxID=2906078 RepID=UPI00385FC711
MKNNLYLRRLVVYTNQGQIAYDENFHNGINIICGDNSSGKSTITHFIFFALGGEFNDFVPEARECQVVFAEIQANDTLVTIKRYIEIGEKSNKINSRIAMHFFWGDYEESLNPPANKYWQKFQYNTTPEKRSFSNVLFELLDLPEVKEENNITIHQVLRLLYIDQESPTSSLFLFEEFDKQSTREAVSDLLLGVYNQDLYTLKLDLYNSEKKLEEIKNEIRLTRRFFNDAFSLNKEHIKTLIENKEIEIRNLNEEISNIRNNIKEVEYNSTKQLEFQILQKQTSEKRAIVIALQNSISSIKNEIIDSEFFIDALNDKYRALNNSVFTREFLGNLPLDYCPECLSKLKVSTVKNSCKLCKQDNDDNFGIIQAKRMQLEIKFQIDESTLLQKIKANDLTKLEAKLEKETLTLDDLQKRVNDSITDIRPFELEQLDSLNFQKGLAEGEILQFRTMLEQASIYEKLLEEKLTIDKNITTFKFKIASIQNNQRKIKNDTINQVQTEGVYLLNNDFDRQKEFTNAEPKDLIIDFANNLVYLKTDNTEKFKQYQKFSASSNFYLKISARFALFLASLSQESMRIPRFIFADNMEDKGIEKERAQNLQNILIKRIQELDPSGQHQLIYTTSYISEDLLESEYIVGEYYKKDNPSLKYIN